MGKNEVRKAQRVFVRFFSSAKFLAGPILASCSNSKRTAQRSRSTPAPWSWHRGRWILLPRLHLRRCALRKMGRSATSMRIKMCLGRGSQCLQCWRKIIVFAAFAKSSAGSDNAPCFMTKVGRHCQTKLFRKVPGKICRALWHASACDAHGRVPVILTNQKTLFWDPVNLGTDDWNHVIPDYIMEDCSATYVTCAHMVTSSHAWCNSWNWATGTHMPPWHNKSFKLSSSYAWCKKLWPKFFTYLENNRSCPVIKCSRTKSDSPWKWKIAVGGPPMSPSPKQLSAPPVESNTKTKVLNTNADGVFEVFEQHQKLDIARTVCCSPKYCERWFMIEKRNQLSFAQT